MQYYICKCRETHRHFFRLAPPLFQTLWPGLPTLLALKWDIANDSTMFQSQENCFWVIPLKKWPKITRLSTIRDKPAIFQIPNTVRTSYLHSKSLYNLPIAGKLFLSNPFQKMTKKGPSSTFCDKPIHIPNS